MTTLEEMARLAKAENAAALKTWDAEDRRKNRRKVTEPLPAFPDTEKFSGKLVPRVMSSLRHGLGVEDMHALGTCTADEARQVIAWMRQTGALDALYRSVNARKRKGSAK